VIPISRLSHGAEQGTCAHLGECDIGCRVYAKNTLDKNYLPEAVKAGARIWPLHLVNNITPIDGGYRVDHDQLTSGLEEEGEPERSFSDCFRAASMICWVLVGGSSG
jgi:cholesterol oxidase